MEPGNLYPSNTRLSQVSQLLSYERFSNLSSIFSSLAHFVSRASRQTLARRSRVQQVRAELLADRGVGWGCSPAYQFFYQLWQSSEGSLRNPQGVHGTQFANSCLFPCLPLLGGEMEPQTASLHRAG